MPVGVHEGHVVEPRVAGRRRLPARALPCVQPDVMVVVARREERGLEAQGTTVGDQVEAQTVAIEGDRAVEVGDAEMDVSDADGGMDGGH